MSKRASSDGVIDLTFSDDEDEGKSPAAAASVSRLDDIRKKLHSGGRHRQKKAKTSSMMGGIGNGDDDDEVEIIKTEGGSKSTESIDYADVEVVQAPTATMELASVTEGQDNTSSTNSGDNGEDDDDDLVMIGTKNELRLPHMRPHCTKFKFQFNPSPRSSQTNDNNKNSDHCDLCYCYVCDCPVKDCKSWDVHCNANDKEYRWIRQRHNNSGQNQQGPSSRNQQTMNSFNTRLAMHSFEDFLGRLSSSGRNSTPSSLRNHGGNRRHRLSQSKSNSASRQHLETGPLSPTHPHASSDRSLRKCSKCLWYSHRRSSYCLKCGRVGWAPASGGPTQSVPYKIREDSVYLGTRKIAFRIVSRDVRAMPKYKDSWASHSVEAAAANNDSVASWTYDESEMEENVFKHRLGKQPTISNIVDLVARYKEDKLKEMAKDKDSKERNLEAIILENQNDLTLLRVLKNVDTFGEKPYVNMRGIEVPNTRDIAGDVTAKWDRENRSGKFEIRVFLPDRCFSNSFDNDAKYTFLLGAFFDIFPFNLLDLCGPFKATRCSFPAHISGITKISADDRAAAKTRMEAAVNEHNDNVELFGSELSLISSTGQNCLGGVSKSTTDFKGVFENYFRETFPRDCTASQSRYDAWENMEEGKLPATALDRYDPRDSTLSIILNQEDRVLACACLRDAARKVNSCLDGGVRGIMEHIENLGHESEVLSEGLNCELLPFQKQSLKWALERETVEGGVQRYFWIPVPAQVGSSKKELYFCPITQHFRKEKPQVVRGGIIAEEMGLGKTIISLGLILKNPAPELPASGSPTASLANLLMGASGLSKWDQDIVKQDADVPGAPQKRGNILSRGTLVICPVSLVGQWIEEAKSKLQNPGLVYPYHGQNRKRDANILAKNAIVVTTYQVLASDDTYHRSKSKDPSNYVPPVEQIRWWRIICDEGHFLRESNTKRNSSISNLVAQNRWLVSGTPISTSVRDLKNQMSILGIEDVNSLFRVFMGSGNPSRQRRRRSWGNDDAAKPEELLFFLRSLMMHHKQKQTYRGTETTLMSLPEKIERTIEVTLSSDEKKEYGSLDNTAKSFYLNFRESHRDDLSKYYLKLSQKLTPMRVASSGGFFPLTDEVNEENESDDDDVVDDGAKRRGGKNEVKYSDFAFTSKFKVLLSELGRIRDEDSTSKSLVFSQYASTLNYLKNELPKHGFQYRTLEGFMSMKQRATALHDFQSDPPTTIFLLSMRAGNCGINLTQANRVFLMEPGFNPALEKQAIGRVHRLGQKREVEIIRLLVKDSVETRIRKFLKHKYGEDASSKHGDDGQEVVIGPIGSQATEKPKSKILAAEFDILFGVESGTGSSTKSDRKETAPKKRDDSLDDKDHFFPDAAHSFGLL